MLKQFINNQNNKNAQNLLLTDNNHLIPHTNKNLRDFRGIS